MRPLLAEPLRDLQDAAAHRRLLAGFALRAHGGLGDLYFHSDEAKATISAWGMHIDFGPRRRLRALFPFLEPVAAVGRSAGAEIRTLSPSRPPGISCHDREFVRAGCRTLGRIAICA